MSSVATRENDRDAHHVPRKCFPGTIKTVEQHVVWDELETRAAGREGTSCTVFWRGEVEIDLASFKILMEK